MIDVVALIRKAAVDALNAQAVVAQEATQDRAPRETGELIESIKVTKATSRSLVSQVYSNADYAIFQHEQLDLVHPTGRSKFMEAAALDEKAAIAAAGATAARRVLG